MFPGIRVQSLIKVAEDQYTSQTLKQREKIRESQTDRDLAGFYIYQNYLNRLRRLHRNYVKKYHTVQKQQEQQQQLLLQQQQQKPNLRRGVNLSPQRKKQSISLPNSHFKNEFSVTAGSTSLWPKSKYEWPITKFRLPASAQPEYLMLGRDTHFDQSEITLPSACSLPPIACTPSPPMGSFKTISECGEENGDAEGGEEDRIYIPCGRENSELRLNTMKSKQRQERDKPGALNFRMWRSVHGSKETPYST
ncbi:hypothetical protein V1264_017077 [Littorina saxatilis]|uniref:Uncharacterized protein n=1 Tax=Littorina saxatilis TaxID=31220 RepID=A0AAN9GEZ6_9CAEN